MLSAYPLLFRARLEYYREKNKTKQKQKQKNILVLLHVKDTKTSKLIHNLTKGAASYIIQLVTTIL